MFAGTWHSGASSPELHRLMSAVPKRLWGKRRMAERPSPCGKRQKSAQTPSRKDRGGRVSGAGWVVNYGKKSEIYRDVEQQVHKHAL